MKKNNEAEKASKKDLELNSDLQGVDKYPGEEKGKKEKVTLKDLKGKKIDADPSKQSDKPAE